MFRKVQPVRPNTDGHSHHSAFPLPPPSRSLRLLRPLLAAALVTGLTLALLGVFAVQLRADGTVRYVALGGADAGACDSVAQPCATLAYALGQAAVGDTLVISPGVYTEAGVTVTRSVNILGSGAANTVLQAHANPAQAADRVVRIEADGVVTITALTIRHGHAAGDYGGGIAVRSGSLTLSGAHVVSNTAALGGGIYVAEGAALRLIGGQVISNVADGDPLGGGGIAVYGGALTQTGATVIAGNRALSGHGGGMYLVNGSAWLDGAAVHHNDSRYHGGGIYVTVDTTPYTARLTVTGGRLAENVAGGDGGGLAVTVNRSDMRATAALTGVLVLSNTALLGGGIHQSSGGAVTLTGGCIVGNSAPAVQRAADALFPLSARATWWGSGSGPGGEGPGSGDAVAGDVDYADFLTVPPPGCGSLDCDLSIRKSAPLTATRPGAQVITYTIAFSNRGAALARAVVLTDWLPIGLTDLQVTAAGAPLTPLLNGPALYAWQAGDLAPGAAGSVTLTGHISPLPASAFTNTAAISAVTFDPAPGDNRAAWGVIVGRDDDGGGPDDPEPARRGVYLPVVRR
jgi:uncharacterized repeat protein (TIGR01451 family)